MTEQPQVNDFLDRLRMTAKVVTRTLFDEITKLEVASARSGLGISGKSMSHLIGHTEQTLNDHARTSFAEAYVIAKDTGLSAATLGDLTSQHVSELSSSVRGRLSKFEKTHRALIDRGFSEINEYAIFLRRQFDIGWANRGTAQMTSSNVINATNVIGVQQGTNSSTQTVSISINRQAAQDAVNLLAAELERLPPDVPTGDISADLDSLRSQLTKSSVSETVLRELGRSLRSGVESVAANAATPALVQAVTTLAVTLGLS